MSLWSHPICDVYSFYVFYVVIFWCYLKDFHSLVMFGHICGVCSFYVFHVVIIWCYLKSFHSLVIFWRICGFYSLYVFHGLIIWCYLKGFHSLIIFWTFFPFEASVEHCKQFVLVWFSWFSCFLFFVKSQSPDHFCAISLNNACIMIARISSYFCYSQFVLNCPVFYESQCFCLS